MFAAAAGAPVSVDELLARVSRHYTEVEVERRDRSRSLRVPRSARGSLPRPRCRTARRDYRCLVDHAPEVIVVFDAADGRLVDANRNAVAFCGLPARATARSRHRRISRPRSSPTDGTRRSCCRRMRAAALEGQPQVFEWLHRGAGGTEVPCEMRLVRLPDAAGA